MQKFVTVHAKAIPMPTPNIDTDQIIPARFLWHAKADGYGKWLFNDLRLNKDDSPKPEFLLNQTRYHGAQVIVADRNFGCGSSREHAVWALMDYGFKVVIASSFGDIFYNNSFKQGLLPIVLSETKLVSLRDAISNDTAGGHVTVDLASQTIEGPGGFKATFEIDAFRKKKLLEGLDEIAVTLTYDERIKAFETKYENAMPWLALNTN
jgi:3-isopropylmalate/(R)-2-methylmalate dehydratase small subunit